MTEDTKAPFTTPRPDPIVAVRIREGAFFLGAFLAVVLVGLLAAMVTWLFHPERPPPCVQNCPPPKLETSVQGGPALTEAHSYRSYWGYTVEYPDAWKVRRSSSDAILFETRTGLLWVESGTTTAPAETIFEQSLGRFNRTALPDITPVGALRGAHIGSEPAQGIVYKATLVPPSGSGTSLLVRIGMLVARHGRVTVLVTALLPYDPNSDQIVGAGDVDYALTEFRWGGE